MWYVIMSFQNCINESKRKQSQFFYFFVCWQCGSYRGLAFLQCKNLNFPYYYRVLQCKTLNFIEEDWRPPSSRGRPESIMQDMMLSGPLRLFVARGWRACSEECLGSWKKREGVEEEVDEEMDEVVDEEEHLQVAVDRKASCGTWCFPAYRDSLKEEKRGWRRMKTPYKSR